MGVAEDALAVEPAPPTGETGSDLVVVIDDVNVVYRVYEQRRVRMKDLVVHRGEARRYRAVHAVRGVSFNVSSGEALGIVGQNGSGKSTLCLAIAGLLPVESGCVYAKGQPILLGVSSALNPRVSGRRNVYIGCLALGMSRAEVDERFDDIVAFAGLADFIELPMKAYSSGMKARLAFAIATAVIPEILIIDEALGVGDERFKRRSRAKIEEIQQQAGAAIIVSHSLGELERMCTRVVWLDTGRVMMDGPPAEVIAAYRKAQED